MWCLPWAIFGAAVADLDQDAGSGPHADPRHRRQDLRKRVVLQQFLDPPGQQFAPVKHGGQRSSQTRDDQRGRLGHRSGDGLLVQSGEDVIDQPLGRGGSCRQAPAGDGGARDVGGHVHQAVSGEPAPIQLCLNLAQWAP